MTRGARGLSLRTHVSGSSRYEHCRAEGKCRYSEQPRITVLIVYNASVASYEGVQGEVDVVRGHVSQSVRAQHEDVLGRDADEFRVGSYHEPQVLAYRLSHMFRPLVKGFNLVFVQCHGRNLASADGHPCQFCLRRSGWLGCHAPAGATRWPLLESVRTVLPSRAETPITHWALRAWPTPRQLMGPRLI